MSFRQALLAATVLAAPVAFSGASVAQPVSGLYIAGGIGYNHRTQGDLSATGGNRTYFQGLPASPGGQIDFEAGYVGVASVGFGFGNGIRAEVEGSYRRNDVESVRGFGSPSITSTFRNVGGRVNSYGVMGNAFYDFVIPGFPVQPYVGLGAGYMFTDFDTVRATRAPITGNTVRINEADGRFAYQGIAGVAVPISFAPGLALTLEYRYMATLETRHEGRVTTPAGGNANLSRGQYESDRSGNHSALLGVRYAFGVAQPRPVVVAAPPLAPAPAVARTYLVFFDFNRIDLTDRARQIIGEAANNSRVGNTRIELAGHADRSGTPAYNQRLSERRANAVAGELVNRGVARSAIVMQGFGESRPLVPTADGVREPQNRRVEIVLR